VSERFASFVTSKPALSDVPIFIVEGEVLSLKDMLYPKKPELVIRVEQLETIKKAKLTEDDWWKLAEEYYVRLSKKPSMNRVRLLRFVRSMSEPSVLTIKEVIDHIRKRDEIGKEALRRYEKLRQYILEAL